MSDAGEVERLRGLLTEEHEARLAALDAWKAVTARAEAAEDDWQHALAEVAQLLGVLPESGDELDSHGIGSSGSGLTEGSSAANNS